MLLKQRESCYGCRALEETNNSSNYTCGIKYSTLWTFEQLVPTEPCPKPKNRAELLIEYKISDRFTALERIAKLDEFEKQTKKRIPSKIKCCNCGEVFEAMVPKVRGSFPKVRKCSHCKTDNYIMDFDNGGINEGWSRERTSKLTFCGKPLFL